MVSYILFNTLIYGTMAMVLSSFVSYSKYVNATLGSVLVARCYIWGIGLGAGRDSHIAILTATVVGLVMGLQYVLIQYFPNEQQRDIVGLIMSLGVHIMLTNIISLLVGPRAITLSGYERPVRSIALLLCGIQLVVWYLSYRSTTGSIYQALIDQGRAVRVLGFRLRQYLIVHCVAGLVILSGLAFLLVTTTSVRGSDSFFYWMKGLGIAILVGTREMKRMYLGAMMYVALEYVLFVSLGLPLAYKESLILIIILLVLMVRPEGLFSPAGRRL